MNETINPTVNPDPGAKPRPDAPAYAPRKRLVRRRDDRMIAGVCSGVADYLGLDVTLVRLLTVLATLLGFGSLIVAYLVMWILVPEE